jgi:lipopolysaccharide transport system ATP-binding protein
MLEMNEVSLVYEADRRNFAGGKHQVLDAISFDLCENETLGIIGRNGVGKTSILRLMAKILDPTSGEVRVTPGKTASLLSIGLGFKGDLTGRDNAMIAAMLQGASRRQARGWLEPIKEFSELGDSFEEPVKTYSSGMAARLGFTTALMTHVDILLIDEVLSVGDAEFRVKAEKAMKDRIAGEQTVVFVSHSQAQIIDVCDRVIWLDGGRIRGEGNPVEVVDAYRSAIESRKPA